MSLFNQMIRGAYDSPIGKENMLGGNSIVKPRTFKETIQDQIAFYKSKIADLEEVRDSLSPEVEKFVEAIQKLG